MTGSAQIAKLFASISLLVGGGSLIVRLGAAGPSSVQLSGFATSLDGRTDSQRHNAVLSARALNGTVIAPGATFSFNKVVRAWSSDEGYVKAPVSYDGELVRAYGGGVCQTSTTLYDAALLAGLPIVERHSHVFAAHYAAPGRDAAVAQPSIDLRFKNPYSWPIRITASAEGDKLAVQIMGAEKPKQTVSLSSEMLETSLPGNLTRTYSGPTRRPGRIFLRSPGYAGCRVITYRSYFESGKEIRRERLSDDTYEAMNRVVQMNRDSEQTK